MKLFSSLLLLSAVVVVLSRRFDTYPDYVYAGNDVEIGDRGLNDGLRVDTTWPKKKPEIGQVAGVDVDGENNVVIFHRANRVWAQSSFDENNVFLETSKGKIPQPVIVTMKKEDGQILKKGGANRFYLPHGLTIDDKNNVWVTDVALHQVFKFGPHSDEPIMTLGEELVPGNDNRHFCKPTSVAVASNGEFFVSDGYCNNRIMKFAANGTFLNEWGHKQKGMHSPGHYDISLPHGVTLADREDILCVADRENRRIQFYYGGLRNESVTGTYWGTIQRKDFGPVMAVTYDKERAALHVVTAPSRDMRIQAKGMTFNANNGEMINQWQPRQGFGVPHDVAVSRSGDEVYVSDIVKNRVWKFVRRSRYPRY